MSGCSLASRPASTAARRNRSAQTSRLAPRSTSKSAVSRTFVQRTRDQLWKLMNRPLADLRLAVMMLDGIELHGRTNIVALGISTEGEKVALGLWDGSTENATIAAALLANLVDRGLDVEQGMLFVIDGSKALRRAIRQVFGNDVPVQRCVQHKQRNVIDHLPERDRQAVKARLRRAWKDTDHDRALEQLTTLATELDHAHPGAAASLREGMEETLTVTRLGITGKLKLTLQSTNPIESMISTVRVIHRNVKHWSSGEMCLRWTAAGMLEAETRFPQNTRPPRPRRPRDRDRTRPHPPAPQPQPNPRQGARNRPHCVTMTSGLPSPKSSTTTGATSPRPRPCLLEIRWLSKRLRLPSGLSWSERTASTGRLVSTERDRGAPSSATIAFPLARAGVGRSQSRQCARPDRAGSAPRLAIGIAQIRASASPGSRDCFCSRGGAYRAIAKAT